MKVLIIRFSSIGDIVLTTPVIRCIKLQTGAEVHFLTKRGFKDILRANPYVDKLWTIKQHIGEVAADLLAEGFDHIIDLHANLRTQDLRLRLFAKNTLHLRPRPTWHAFDKLNFEKYLLVKFGVNRLPNAHIVDRYLSAAAALNIRNDGAGLDYFIPQQEAVNLVKEGLPSKYLVLVIGAAHATKRLTVPQMSDFCRHLEHPIILLGGPAERDTGAAIANSLQHVTNACGQFKLGGSADLIRQATVVVTHDTGMMHVAAAFKKPIISIWGNTVPDFGMYPYLPEELAAEQERRMEVNGLPCRPCSKIGHQTCPKGHFKCIKEQDPANIAAAAERLLATIS